LLQRNLLELQAVLVPNEVRGFRVELVTFHASFEQREDVSVVRVSRETQRTAILHVLFKFDGLVHAELVKSNLLFLLLNVVVLFVL